MTEDGTLDARKIDCHVHTGRCGHGTGTPAEFAAAARTAGIGVLTITDHLPFPGGPEAGYSMREYELPAYVADVDTLRGDTTLGVELLLGVEVDWLPGAEERLARLADARLDVVLGSVHVLDGWAFDDPDLVDRYEHTDVPALWERYFEVLAQAARSGLFDVMAHPDLVKKFGYVPQGDLGSLYERAARVFAEAGVAVEVNTAGLRRPCAEIYPSLSLLRACRAAGVSATVGSDAHCAEEVGAGWQEATALLREAGYDRVVYFRERRPIEWRL